MKLGKLNKDGTYYITLPKRLIMALQWDYGMELEVILDKNGNLIIKQKK